MHSFPACDTVVEPDGHVGHGAILHGCHIGRNVLVGMNAVVMDNARVGENSIVAALALVPANMQIPPRSMVVGLPGRIVREVTQEELAWKTRGTEVYQELAQRSRQGLRLTEPLRSAEADRPKLPQIEGFDPLFKVKAKGR